MEIRRPDLRHLFLRQKLDVLFASSQPNAAERIDIDFAVVDAELNDGLNFLAVSVSRHIVIIAVQRSLKVQDDCLRYGSEEESCRTCHG